MSYEKSDFIIGKLYEFTGSNPTWTSCAQAGSIWRYVLDDGTFAPRFEYVSGQKDGVYKVGDKTFLHVSQFKAYEDASASSDYSINVDANGTRISVDRRLSFDQMRRVIAIIEGV